VSALAVIQSPKGSLAVDFDVAWRVHLMSLLLLASVDFDNMKADLAQ
jgi:hypothetical protein